MRASERTAALLAEYGFLGRSSSVSRLDPSGSLTMYALSIRGLTKTYKNGVQALRGVDFEVTDIPVPELDPRQVTPLALAECP